MVNIARLLREGVVQALTFVASTAGFGATAAKGLFCSSSLKYVEKFALDFCTTHDVLGAAKQSV